MAEQNENNTTKKKPPLIPPNFVTLVQLKERWNKEQERKQREKEEHERKQREQEEQQRKQREQEEQQRRKEEEKQKQIVEEKESGSRIQRSRQRNHSRKRQELAVATVSAVTAIESAGAEVESQGLKDSKKKKWRKQKKKGRNEDKVRAENEEVIRREKDAPPPQNVEKESVPPKRERRPRGTPRDVRPTIQNDSQNQMMEIEKKFGGLSVDGGNRKDHRYSRQNRYSNRDNSEFGRDYGSLRRPRERDAGMMWVKKGEAGDGNAGEVQTSDPLPK